MSTYDDDLFGARLGTGLRTAVQDLVPAPTLVPAARRGGRRRLVRRRQVVVGAGLVAVIAGAAAPRAIGSLDRLPLLTGTTTPSPDTRTLGGGGAYAALYDGPARGDRVDDREYVAAVLAAWTASHASSLNADRGIFADLRGEPKVVWAADTPAGPAAAVVQKVVLHPGDNLNEPEGPSALIGLVGVDDQGRPRVVADDYWKSDNVAGDPPMTVWAVDPSATVVAALDPGSPVGWADRWSYGDDGSRRMTFTPIPLQDGGGSVRLPAGVRRNSFVATRLPFREFLDALIARGVAQQSESDGPDQRLQWADPSGFGRFPLAGTQADSLADPEAMLDEALRARVDGIPSGEGFPLWTASGRLPDGRTLVAGDLLLDHDPSHAYVLITAGAGHPEQVAHGGAVDPAATLPFHVRLPERLGQVVARKGAALAWRTGPSGTWTDAGTDAALIPDPATEVRVTVDGSEQVVTLPK